MALFKLLGEKTSQAFLDRLGECGLMPEQVNELLERPFLLQPAVVEWQRQLRNTGRHLISRSGQVGQ